MLYIHRGERADRLVDALGELLATPLADALAAEVVAVPTRGVERWLTQRLSTVLGASPGRADGVCGNIDFPFPGRLVGGATGAATGLDRESDPWLPERSVWPLLDVVEDHLHSAWLAPLAVHLGRGTAADDAAGVDEYRRARRFPTVRRLADLFDRYGVHRPAMIRAWAAGADTDGSGEPLPGDVVWQAQLWRLLRGRLEVASPAERLTDACARLRDEPELLDLPSRLSLFGLTRLPASYLDVLHALAARREVHLFLLHPSPRLWAYIAQTCATPAALPRRREDPSADMPRNPLLAKWGQDARETQMVLTAGDGDCTDDHRGLDGEPRSLLQRMQADVRADRAPPGPPLPGAEDPRAVLDPSDHSVAVHACHGRARQVEVLRDAILHRLADDPTLELRDVVVMCPDIEAFAPLIQATFGTGAAGAPDADAPDDAVHEPAHTGLPHLPVRLADRSLRQTNPVLGVVAELLELAPARVTASQVVELASREPVRRRFHLDDDDPSRLQEWVAAAGIRWGLDAKHRAPFQLDAVEANTWRAGLDRLLLGVAMTDNGQALWGNVVPLDDVNSTDIALAGRLAELVDRLDRAIARLSQAQPIADWAQAIAEAVEALTATAEHDAWQQAQLQRLLDEVVTEARVDGSPSARPLELAEVRELLADRLRGRPTRASFRTGHLTMCTLVPMRSVPHRVVCLLGLDDGVFPRQSVPDGDDLVQRDPCVGDRDPRSEDRQLLLDALMAATEHLVVTYTGRDERTNAVCPPAVPVGELLDVVDATVRTNGDSHGSAPTRPRDRVLVYHPLQPFDARNFTAGGLVDDRRWSFDATMLDGARTATGPRCEPQPFLAQRLPPAPRGLVGLDDLVDFVRHPVQAFLRQRLRVMVSGSEDELDDALPVELEPLEQWRVGQRLLEARLAGVDRDTCRAAEVARGHLPPGMLGQPLLDRIAEAVEGIVARAHALADGEAEPTSVEVSVDLGGGRVLVGTVPDVVGARIRPVTYSRLAAPHRLAAWVRLLALTAAYPDHPWEAQTVGRGHRRGAAVAHITDLGGAVETRQATARAHLATLIDLYDRGMCEPLPLYCRASAAYAQARAEGRKADSNARGEWESGWANGQYQLREDREPEHQLVLGGVPSFDAVLADPPRDDEHGPGWATDEPTRFGRYARRLWDGLLAFEQVTP